MDEVDRELAALVASGQVIVLDGPDGPLYRLAGMASYKACAGCSQELHVDDDGGLVDSVGDSYCETRYDDCGACEHGEPHPHWTSEQAG